MNYFKQHIAYPLQSTLFIVIAIFMVLMGSCAVRSSIKSWANIANSTAQTPVKTGSLLALKNSEKCSNGDLKEVKSSQITSYQSFDLSPAILFTLGFILLLYLGFRSKRQQGYSPSFVLSDAIPIFLRDRNLQI